MPLKFPEAPGGIAQALERARSLKPKLEAATDELNRSIEAAEAALVSLQIGVRASVVMDSNPEDFWSRCLTFGKDSRAWRLVEEGYDDPEMPQTIIPLVNASREIRLRAAEMLPDLVRCIVTRAEAEIQRVEAATSAARKVITAISSDGAK